MLNERLAPSTLSGRFAPSPTGPLHMGSLVTALASFCDIKQRDGSWFVRLDDIDPPRFDQAGLDHIIQALHVHGLRGDGPMRKQSENTDRYRSAREALTKMGYYCDCSRRQLANQLIYPGHCRNKRRPARNHAMRLSVDEKSRQFSDDISGLHSFVPARDFGDFIVWRRDDLVTYHLATACDDGQDYSHVLRGEDLFVTTGPQLLLMERLGLSPPSYAHIPVLTFPDGTKLSKQTHAPALDNSMPEKNLQRALYFLGQNPPIEDLTVSQWIDWAVSNWQIKTVPATLPTYENPFET